MFLFEKLMEIKEENLTSFHVPGHKNGRLLDSYMENLKGTLSQIDITEIPGADDLHSAEDAILESQKRAAKLYGTKASFFLVNGTTCGIYAMIMGTTEPGDKVIVSRDCHKSVINGLFLGGLNPVYIMPEVDRGNNLILGVDPKKLEQVILENLDAKAVVLTYPTYHGICGDIDGIAEVVNKNGMLLLVDEAHGAHFKMSDLFPKSAIDAGADVVVHSVHKSLPSFTQSSMLHINSEAVDGDKIKKMLSIHQSSSPSYLLMASLDIAMDIFERRGTELVEGLMKALEVFYAQAELEENICLLTEHYLEKFGMYRLDPSKITLLGKPSNVDPNFMELLLRERFGVQAEYSNHDNILFISTICSLQEDYDKLLGALRCDEFKPYNHEYGEFELYNLPEVLMNPKEAFYGERISVKLKDACGEISGEYVIPYPPGIPLLAPGERITEEVVALIRNEKSLGLNITGMKNKAQGKFEIILKNNR